MSKTSNYVININYYFKNVKHLTKLRQNVIITSQKVKNMLKTSKRNIYVKNVKLCKKSHKIRQKRQNYINTSKLRLKSFHLCKTRQITSKTSQLHQKCHNYDRILYTTFTKAHLCEKTSNYIKINISQKRHQLKYV